MTFKGIWQNDIIICFFRGIVNKIKKVFRKERKISFFPDHESVPLAWHELVQEEIKKHGEKHGNNN